MKPEARAYAQAVERLLDAASELPDGSIERTMSASGERLVSDLRLAEVLRVPVGALRRAVRSLEADGLLASGDVARIDGRTGRWLSVDAVLFSLDRVARGSLEWSQRLRTLAIAIPSVRGRMLMASGLRAAFGPTSSPKSQDGTVLQFVKPEGDP